MAVHKIPIIDSSNTTASASDILQGKTAVSQREMIAGNIPVLESQTYTPGTTNIIIQKGNYLNGEQIIQGDSNLKPENIKNGVSIFGKTGIYEGNNAGCGLLYQGKYEYGFNMTAPLPSIVTSLSDFNDGFLFHPSYVTSANSNYTYYLDSPVFRTISFMNKDEYYTGEENIYFYAFRCLHVNNATEYSFYLNIDINKKTVTPEYSSKLNDLYPPPHTALPDHIYIDFLINAKDS